MCKDLIQLIVSLANNTLSKRQPNSTLSLLYQMEQHGSCSSHCYSFLGQRLEIRGCTAFLNVNNNTIASMVINFLYHSNHYEDVHHTTHSPEHDKHTNELKERMWHNHSMDQYRSS